MWHFLPFYIGFRYIGSKRRNGFLAFVSVFALLGMTLGVFALIVVLSVMNGFDHELKDRILRIVPHTLLQSDDGIRDWQGVMSDISSARGLVASSPYVSGKGLVSTAGGVRGVEVHGIDPELESKVSVVSQSLLVGFAEDLRPGEYNIVVGSLLARFLNVSVGDKVSVTLPQVSVNPAGVFPRSKRFTIVGIFEVGAQMDEYLSLIHIRDAQKLFRSGDRVHGLRIKYDDIYQAKSYNDELAPLITEGTDYKLEDWSQSQGSLFQAVKMEKIVVGIMLSIIIAVAAFNIITSLVMMVTEKRSDIAVLRTMGMSRNSILAIFMAQGTILGALGVIIGCASGVITAYFLTQLVQGLESYLGIYVFDPNVYFVSYLPSVLRVEDTLLVCGLGLLLSFLATLYPSYRASTISPAEALRYDT